MRKVSPATFARQSLGIHKSHQGSRPGHISVETTGIGYSAGTLSLSIRCTSLVKIYYFRQYGYDDG
jgi:hypothetical protein